MPRKPAAELRALRQLIPLIRQEITTKRWAMARFDLDRARALVKALPAEQTVREREQLTALRKKYARIHPTAADTPAKVKPKARRNPAQKKRAKAAAPQKKPLPKTPQPSQPPRPTAPPELADRLLNRAALGYGPADGA